MSFREGKKIKIVNLLIPNHFGNEKIQIMMLLCLIIFKY